MAWQIEESLAAARSVLEANYGELPHWDKFAEQYRRARASDIKLLDPATGRLEFDSVIDVEPGLKYNDIPRWWGWAVEEEKKYPSKTFQPMDWNKCVSAFSSAGLYHPLNTLYTKFREGSYFDLLDGDFKFKSEFKFSISVCPHRYHVAKAGESLSVLLNAVFSEHFSRRDSVARVIDELFVKRSSTKIKCVLSCNPEDLLFPSNFMAGGAGSCHTWGSSYATGNMNCALTQGLFVCYTYESESSVVDRLISPETKGGILKIPEGYSAPLKIARQFLFIDPGKKILAGGRVYPAKSAGHIQGAGPAIDKAMQLCGLDPSDREKYLVRAKNMTTLGEIKYLEKSNNVRFASSDSLAPIAAADDFCPTRVFCESEFAISPKTGKPITAGGTL